MGVGRHQTYGLRYWVIAFPHPSGFYLIEISPKDVHSLVLAFLWGNQCSFKDKADCYQSHHCCYWYGYGWWAKARPIKDEVRRGTALWDEICCPKLIFIRAATYASIMLDKLLLLLALVLIRSHSFSIFGEKVPQKILVLKQRYNFPSLARAVTRHLDTSNDIGWLWWQQLLKRNVTKPR